MVSHLFFRRTVLLFTLLLPGLPAAVRAGDDPYPNRIDPSVLDSAQKGPNASVYFSREIPVLFRSDQPVDVLNLSSATANVLMLGKYHSSRGAADLELHGALKDGLLEMALPLGKLDAALYEWEEVGAQPDALASLDPRLQSLTFRDSGGFRAVYVVRKSIEYQLTVDVPYDLEKGALETPVPTFSEAADFIRWLDRDSRARAILDNNSGGLPVFVSRTEEPDTMAAGFLSNTIRFNRRTGKKEYAYTESLSRLVRLPEIKRLLKDPAVKAFVADSKDVAVKALGSDSGYAFSLSKEGGQRLEATLVDKRVTVRP